jgi:hypothetical protein
MIPPRLKRFYALAISIGLAVTVLMLSLLVPIVGTTTDFSIYNAGWNGTSKLAIKSYQVGKLVPALEVRNTGTGIDPVVTSLADSGIDPARGALFIIGPSKPFSKSDGDYVAGFLSAGGTVVLADDFGTGNSLLSQLNTTSRFADQLVVDFAFEKKPEFVVAYNFVEGSPLTDNVSMMLLNYPSAISKGSRASVLATTSSASWMDMNGNEFRDPDEPVGPFPILTVESVGLGTLVLLSDPSVLINSMAQYLDNAVFADNLLAFASEGRSQVLFDESHRNFVNPIAFSMRLTGQLSDGSRFVIVLVAVTAFFLTTTDIVPRTYRLATRTGLRVWRYLAGLFAHRREETVDTFMSDEELVGKVLEKHPDWRRGVLTRLIRQINRHGAVK